MYTTDEIEYERAKHMTRRIAVWVLIAFVIVYVVNVGNRAGIAEQDRLSRCSYLGSRIEGAILRMDVHRYQCGEIVVESRFAPQ